MRVFNIETKVVDSFLKYYHDNEHTVDKEAYTHFLMYGEEVYNEALGDHEFFGSKTFCHGNILWHKAPVPPHVDICGKGNTQTVIVPLIVEKPDQKLVVFDQTYDHEATWIGDLPLQMNEDRSGDSAIRKSMFNTEGMQNLTDKPCPDEVLQHLPYQHDDFYHGMSGEVIDWEVGTAIIFDSHRVHVTGNMDSVKIGATSFVR